MTRYRVRHTGAYDDFIYDHPRYYEASSLKHEFGLPYSLETIIRLWEQYSDSMAAGWMTPNKEDVERVFGVELEEIDGD